MMKKLLLGLVFLGSSTVFAAAATDINKNWTCTTNASSTEVATEKAADDQMANTQNSATASFEFAAKNCRDCTKITCEVHD
jgi:hypothetical protein